MKEAGVGLMLRKLPGCEWLGLDVFRKENVSEHFVTEVWG